MPLTRVPGGCATLLATRPTAVNLRWALDIMTTRWRARDARAAATGALAEALADDESVNRAIGDHGLASFAASSTGAAGKAPQRAHPLQRRLAGDGRLGHRARADLRRARGRLAGARLGRRDPAAQPGRALTAWELGQHGVPHTLIVDNAGGHLMQRGQVDLCIVGTDRTTATGDVCNKIGTYLKALAAHDNGVPFYVAAPSPPSTGRSRDGRRDPDRGARRPSEVVGRHGTCRGRRASRRAACAGGDAGRATRPST